MKKLLFASLLWAAFVNYSVCQSLNENQSIEESLESLKWNFAGPTRGGRSTAVCGIPNQIHTFFMGSTGGGIWKTNDAGNTWKNISDGEIPCGSIGSITYAPSATYIMYAGTGSGCPRGNVSIGCGMFKSEDSGDTWSSIGLEKAGQIPKIIVHPSDENIVFAAALGNPFIKNEERGVYKSTDGGDSWRKVLFLNDSTGAVDLAIHPTNPRIIYAGMWRTERKPHTLIDGSESGGLYKSADGGESWQRVINGLPGGIIGRIGIAISPTNPNRMWVLQVSPIEEKSGLYRSDDGGASFSRICRDHKLRQRAWYYTHVFADPKNENAVYVCNTSFYKSIDGGKTFDKRYRVPHGDTHDLWINPEQPAIMINSNDGGATITLNKGETWSPQDNQPTPEFYRLTTDNQWPFRMYSGQQDNSTISVPSKRLPAVHSKEHWHNVGGGESADIAIHPNDPNVVYATTYSGIITRKDMRTGEMREIGAYPHYTEGTEMRDLKYRWQWNFPIRVSKHDPNILFMGSNYVHVSKNEGQSWEVISPDLSRNIDAYFDIPGGPVQHDATGVEVYGTVFSMEESPDVPGTIWVGSDDGKMHITHNWQNAWEDISTRLIPNEATINHIHLPEGQPDVAYVAAYHYRHGDFMPYILKTENQGKKWKLLTNGKNGIPSDHFVRAVVSDPINKNLLYAGTEFGIYVSINDGDSWEPLQLNLPTTPITDMEVKGNTLVLSTQGRGFWTFDHLNILRSSIQSSAQEIAKLIQPLNGYRSNIYHPVQIPIQVNQADSVDKYVLEIQDANGKKIKVYRKDPDKKKQEAKLKLKVGLNLIEWNLQFPAPRMVEDLVMMDMSYPGRGPKAPPGEYKVKLFDQDLKELSSSTFEIQIDPRWKASKEALAESFALAQSISYLITQSQSEIMELRSIREQVQQIIDHAKDADFPKNLEKEGKEIIKKTKSLEDMIYQNQIETSQDEINFPRKFTNHLIRLYRVVLSAEDRPTGGQLERWKDVQEEYQPFKMEYQSFLQNDLKAFEAYLESIDMPLIITSQQKS